MVCLDDMILVFGFGWLQSKYLVWEVKKKVKDLDLTNPPKILIFYNAWIKLMDYKKGHFKSVNLKSKSKFKFKFPNATLGVLSR